MFRIHRPEVAVVAALLTLAFLPARSVHAQTPARVFELRTYTTEPGKLEALKKRFREHTVKLFEKHGITSIGYWVPQDAPRSENTLIYIVSHPSRKAAEENWAAFGKDPEWQKVRTESEAGGKIVNRVESIFMEPADFSALK